MAKSSELLATETSQLVSRMGNIEASDLLNRAASLIVDEL